MVFSRLLVPVNLKFDLTKRISKLCRRFLHLLSVLFKTTLNVDKKPALKVFEN